MNRTVFFDYVRKNPFGGKMTAEQVDGCERILDYRDDTWPAMPDNELAYVLATVKWETAHKMQPIKEMGSDSYLRSKKYWPYIGRGLVQITWKDNYEKFGIADRPDAALEWPTALDILFRGMIFGMFTGKKLSSYISDSKHDYVSARRIINGTDRAKEIADIAEAFRKALLEASRAEPDEPEVAPPDPMPEPEPAPEPSFDFTQELLAALRDPDVRETIASIIAEKLNG